MQRIIFLLIFIFLAPIHSVLACDSCLIQRVGRDHNDVTSNTSKGKFLFKYWFERQEWKHIEPEIAHDLHDEGHDIHVKTNEDVHHFDFGYRWTEDLVTTLDIPYVRRGSLEIHDHANLGKKYTSEGLGDTTVTTAYDLWKKSNQKVSLLAGIKLPTGETKEANSQGERFETEMQPGTGSDDYLLGGLYRRTFENVDITANAIYTLKTEGVQNYEFGDVFSTTLFVDYIPSEDNRFSYVRPGLLLNLKEEFKHTDSGQTQDDSGGTTVFAGPEISISNDMIDVFANVQWPIYQDRNGVHQEIDLIWNLGVKVDW